MDKNRKTSPTIITHNQIPPAQLWIGPHTTLLHEACHYLQSRLCDAQGCGSCNSCKQITQQQHHAIRWLYPEKQYTLEHINSICNTMAYALDAGQQFFFILQKADTLTTVCCNRLLKSIEEPPLGYHFLLLAERLDTILPTIRSRCLTRSWYTKNNVTEHQELFTCFTKKRGLLPPDFLSIIESSKINEYESMALIDMILHHWMDQYKKARVKGNITATYSASTVITQLKKAMSMPPMPGSSKLFWKNLFLQIYG